MNSEQLMRIYLRECSQHAEILSEALDEARHWLPFAPDSIDHVGKEQTRVLDQVAYRFAKLQDTMGQKVLPAVLELAQEPITPDATFAVKLNWLERIGALPSADEWKNLRAARNAIAHEYPDDPELRVFRGGAAPTSGRGGDVGAAPPRQISTVAGNAAVWLDVVLEDCKISA